MLEKIAKKEGFYQSIEIGKKVYKGWRDCDNRWKVIEPHINKNSVIMDIGSNYGFFGKKIVDKYNDNLIWSIESCEKRSEIQKEMIKKNKIKNIVLCNKKIEIIDLLNLARSSEQVDVILALSVIHYFPKNQIPNIIWLMSLIAPTLIIEPPSIQEINVAEKETVKTLGSIERYLNIFYQEVTKIGEASSPKSKDIMRPIYRAHNKILKRNGVTGYIGGEMGRSHNIEYKNSKWSINNKKNWKTGLNIENLRIFNLIYPALGEIVYRAGQRYYDVMKNDTIPTDCRLWNCLYTPFDVEVIDYKEKTGVYEDWDNYAKKTQRYTPEDYATIIMDHI